MNTKFLCTLLLLGQFVFGQTEKHIKVPGTKCSLIPPTGFVAASSFSGFQNIATSSSIMINEIPAPYQELIDGFTPAALKAKGINFISKQTVDFNNSKATLVKVSQPANGITYLKQMLIFGDTKSTVLVNGIYPEASTDKEVVIIEALLSTIYSAAQNDNPLDAAIFTIDVADTDFKLIKYLSGNLLYSTDGQIPTQKPTLIVGNSIAKILPHNQRVYAEERIKKLPGGERNVVKQINDLKIDNLNGYEIIADGQSKENKPVLVYQVMLFNERGDYYIILGQAKEDFEKYLEAYKKIAKTFKRK